MIVPEQGQKPEYKVRPGLNGDELNHFRRFLKATGRKAGPFVKMLILRELNEEDKREKKP